MISSIFLAALNGGFIGASRGVNGRHSMGRGPFKASLWNHISGFILLTAILLVTGRWPLAAAAAAPWTAYLGGFIGAVYVAINAYVFSRLGATNAALMVISGQMIAAVMIESLQSGAAPTPARCLGVAVVVLGIYLTKAARSPRRQSNLELA